MSINLFKKLFIGLLIVGLTVSQSSIIASANQFEEGTTYKEVTTYDDFISADTPVSIDPNLLTEKQLKHLNVQKNETPINFSVEGPPTGSTKTWSKKIPKSTIVGGLNAGIGIATIIGAFYSAGTTFTVSGGVVSVVNGLSQMSNARGIQFGGNVEYRLVRKSFYEVPKKDWVYNVTWAKVYY